jgi:hypothetical protein
MNSHQIFAALSGTLATEILEYSFANDKPLYRASLGAVALARKMRPVFLERHPRAERFTLMADSLGRPALETAAGDLIRTWLLKKQTALLIDFLDALKIPHENGVVKDLPASVPDTDLQSAVEKLLGKYPPQVVAVYLHAFNDMNAVRWSNLDALLENDPRLKLKREG